MINRKIPWTSQPQYPVDIDWSNPLTNGLALARNQANEYGSGLAPFVYSNGVNQRAVSATSGGVVLPPTRIGPEGTILFIAKNKVGTGTSEYFWDGETATNRDIFYTGVGKATFGWYIGGVEIADATPIAASFLDSTVPTVATLAWSNGSQQAYKNGVLHTSKAVALSVNTTRSIRLYSRYTSIEGMLTGGMALFLYFNRKLSAVEIKSLSDNPWQIFKSQSRRIWVAGTSSGSTGTVAVTNANDTSAASGTTTIVGTLAKTNAMIRQRHQVQRLSLVRLLERITMILLPHRGQLAVRLQEHPLLQITTIPYLQVEPLLLQDHLPKLIIMTL